MAELEFSCLSGLLHWRHSLDHRHCGGNMIHAPKTMLRCYMVRIVGLRERCDSLPAHQLRFVRPVARPVRTSRGGDNHDDCSVSVLRVCVCVCVWQRRQAQLHIAFFWTAPAQRTQLYLHTEARKPFRLHAPTFIAKQKAPHKRTAAAARGPTRRPKRSSKRGPESGTAYSTKTTHTDSECAPFGS